MFEMKDLVMHKEYLDWRFCKDGKNGSILLTQRFILENMLKRFSINDNDQTSLYCFSF